MCCNSFGLTLSLRNDTCPRRVFFPVRPFNNPQFRIVSFKPQSKLNDAVPASFYDLLGIPETGSLPEIKHAYKQLARKVHPDVSPPGRVEEYTRRFIRVQEAYETLSDPGRRALYDRDMGNSLRFALSSRRRYGRDEPMEEKSEWKNRWQSQVSELKRRSMSKDNTSWGARMRKQRQETSSS